MNEEKSTEEKLFELADKYKLYLKDDETKIDIIIEKLESLAAIIDSQIEEMKKNLVGRGSQKYMIDHITNAIAIQTEIQSLLKDKRSIKEKALDMAMKQTKVESGNDSEDSSEILVALNKLIKTQKLTEVKKVQQSTEDLNKMIEEKLKKQD